MIHDARRLMDEEELFGDGRNGRAGWTFLDRRKTVCFFGSKSTGKVKFELGIRSMNFEKLKRTGELIAECLSDYDVAQRICAEHPGREPGWRHIAKLRAVIEAERGPFKCRCGRLINHRENCEFKTPRKGQNQPASVEAVRDIRQHYKVDMTGLQLAQKWNLSKCTVLRIARGVSHRAPGLKLAQYKVRMYVTQAEKIKRPLETLNENRAFAPDEAREQLFNATLSRARQLLEESIAALREAAQVK
jgi:hypothetical protein